MLNKNQNCVSFCVFYAISPIHAGSGTSLAAVDLPIQRERHTNWPHIQASGVKGAMRAHYRDFVGDKKEEINYLFGSDTQDGWDKNEENIAGAVSVSDAKLLAFPVRSNIAPFVWITCPAILKRLSNDWEFAENAPLKNLTVEGERSVCLEGKLSGDVILEDMVVTVDKEEQNPIPQEFPKLEKLLLVSNDAFKYAVENCTEIQTQIKIDSEKGTAQEGALRYQELLPADSVLYSVVYFSRTAFDHIPKAETVRAHIQDVIKNFIQIGGDETLGRGICRINWINGGGK
ncbi:MAG TPA: type III-B CRISPR module RAMP protein Cmr4 [Smithellaceae bacterium]|nr:type III-B CRISPR module RAMP protein Cmr4 [Smithellaceae bacterium]HRS90268.1 type III-B CRISPR module RAMP protein Cmr4 [Smithellaceae bacterium]